MGEVVVNLSDKEASAMKCLSYSRSSWIVAVVGFALTFLPTHVSAVCRPYIHHNDWNGWGGWGNGWGYGWGWGGVVYPLGQDALATRYIAGESQIAGAAIAAQQTAATQDSIRNTLAADAMRRANAIVSQQESNSDLVTQSQMQQAAARQILAMRYISTAEPMQEKPAALDIYQWPQALQSSQFTADRTEAETPRRRAAEDGRSLSIKDYRDILTAVARLRATLSGVTARITYDEYIEAKDYLDQMAADARANIEKLEKAQRERAAKEAAEKAKKSKE
jgi:hypothetical protein